MNESLKRLAPALGLLVLLAGCGSDDEHVPTAPTPIPPLASIVVSPEAVTLAVGNTQLFTATAVDTVGDPYTGTLDWESTATAVFTVSSAGLVTAVSEGSALLVVSGGGVADSASVEVYATTAGWAIQTSNASEDLHDVFGDPGGRLAWVVGNGGVVLSTGDAGTTWTRLAPSTYDLHGVWFTSATEGWAVGDGGTVLHTENGGTNWTRLTNVGSGDDLRDVHFTHPDTGWVVGANGQLLTTWDRGETWSNVHRLSQTHAGVMFAGAEGWVVGENGGVVGSHDAGDSWFTVNPSLTSQPLRAVWRRSAELAVAVGANGTLLRTAAGPDSVAWSLGNLGATYQSWGVCLPTATVGYAVGWNGTAGFVLRSDDGFATEWRPQEAASASALRGVFFVDALRGWAVGEAGVIRYTNSGGE